MIDSWGPGGTFIFYSIINFGTFWFVRLVLKETEGLSDRQKKSLYQKKRKNIDLQNTSQDEK